jgi:purine-nucleoside phosphorylase
MSNVVDYNGRQDILDKNGVVDDKFRGRHYGKCEERLDAIHQTSLYLQSATRQKPTVVIICGSGFGSVVDCMKECEVVEFTDIPNFASCTVPGHAGRLVFGTLGGVSLVCMQGRLHAYEEHSMWQLTFPVRVMADMGVKILIATNACGAVNTDYKVGDLMIVKDHINLPGLGGLNPLVGIVDERFGTRFPFLNGAYNRKLRLLAWSVSRRLGLVRYIHEGVYLVQCGPSFETPAELRMIRTMGADVVGMSTAPEVIVARQCGLLCFGLSLIANICILDDDDASG